MGTRPSVHHKADPNMRKAVFLVGCGLLMAAEAAVMPSSMPSLIPSVRYDHVLIAGGP
jgi:hypothetical protein